MHHYYVEWNSLDNTYDVKITGMGTVVCRCEEEGWANSIASALDNQHKKWQKLENSY
jgi:hypothetical protein